MNVGHHRSFTAWLGTWLGTCLGVCLAGLAAPAQAAVTPEDAARQLMDFAQRQYPLYFPGTAADQSAPPFRYRYYPATRTYLGVVVTPDPGYTLGGVYVMGGSFGNQPLLAGLLSQFITPVDTQAAGPPGPNNGCADLQALWAPGTTTEVTMQFAGAVSGSSVVESTVGALTSYEGQAAVETSVKTSTNNNGTVQIQSQGKTYSRVTGDGEVTQYGGVFEAASAGAAGSAAYVTRSVYAPPWVQRWFRLAPGQSLSHGYVATFTTSQTLNGVSTSSSFVSSSTETIRFVGRERLSVPAGTFDTCRYETTYPHQTTPPTTQWLIDGKGLAIQFMSGDAITQRATSVKINGQPVTQ